MLAADRVLPAMHRGDLVAVFSAGEYGFVMASQYNSRPRCAEVLVEGADIAGATAFLDFAADADVSLFI